MDVPCRSRTPSVADLIAAYAAGASCAALGTRYGYSEAGIRGILRRHGVARRPARTPLKPRVATNCLHCGTVMHVRPRTLRKYCSDPCRVAGRARRPYSCSVCEKEVFVAGYCMSHYFKDYNSGTPLRLTGPDGRFIARQRAAALLAARQGVTASQLSAQLGISLNHAAVTLRALRLRGWVSAARDPTYRLRSIYRICVEWAQEYR